MENTPKITPAEQAPETKESKKSKKKKVESLGAFAVEPKQEFSKADDENLSFWRKPENPKLRAGSELEANLSLDHETDEITAPLEHLSEEERQFAVQSIVESARAQETDPLLADEASSAADQAVAEFHDVLMENGQDLDAAEKAVLQELGEQGNEGNEGNEENEPDVAEAVDDEPDASVASTTKTKSSAPPLGSNAGSSGGGRIPPRPPSPPVAGGVMPPHGPSGVPFGPAIRPNLAPVTAVASSAERIVQRGDTAGAALTAGVVGYLIGRRRGRINTEKRLLPVQKKLQKEVVVLQSQVQASEAKIRKAAIKQVRTGKYRPINKTAEQLAPAPMRESAIQPNAEKSVTEQQIPVQLSANERQASTAPVIEKSEKPVVERIAERPGPVRVLEVHKITPQQEAPSHLGHMIVTAESRLKTATAEKSLSPQPLSSEKQYATINRAELLRVSEKIIVDGTSLRQIYESRLVGEKGLRRLVQEHFRGGDLKKALRREIVQREIDFERDPIMRDHAASASEPQGGGKSSNSAALQQMLRQANVDLDTEKEANAFLKARADHEERTQNREQKRRKTMDVSLITTIGVLVSLLVIVELMRH